MIEIFDNIRGLYDFSPPCEELRPFLEFFSESSADKTARLTGCKTFTVEMYPSWTPTFWINLGKPYRLTIADDQRLIACDTDVLVVRDSRTIRYNNASDHIFTVKFHPGALEATLGINQTALASGVTPLHNILPRRILQLLRTAGSFEKRVAVIQQFLLANLNHRPKKDHYTHLIRESIGTYEEAAMLPNTRQLAEKTFVQSKTINRYFHRIIGIPPKKYFSTLRARTALTSYLANRADFSPESFGYYDRSHFYRSVRQFTGRGLFSQS